MATVKKRIEISISGEMDQLIAALARRDKVSQATKAERLIRMALETEEDRVFSKIADARDVPGVKYLSHKEAWG